MSCAGSRRARRWLLDWSGLGGVGRELFEQWLGVGGEVGLEVCEGEYFLSDGVAAGEERGDGVGEDWGVSAYFSECSAKYRSACTTW